MKFRALGNTGVQVSQLCFGTMSFGGDADEAAAAKSSRACGEAGSNCFDTADQYTNGRSEEFRGGRIGAQGTDGVTATKAYNPMGRDINARGGWRRHVVRAAEASLKRLRTDRVDVLYLHQYDPLTPAEETLRALEDLVRAGKVLYPAVSNYAACQTQRALDIQRGHGWAPLQVTQPMYNLVKRQAEVAILPQSAASGIGVVPYSPAGGGLLSGKYSVKGAQGRIAANKMYESRYGEPWMREVAAAFAEYCAKRGVHPMSMAVAWGGSHPAVTAPIIRPRRPQQLPPSLASVKIDMPPQLRAAISAPSPTAPPAAERLEEIKPKL